MIVQDVVKCTKSLKLLYVEDEQLIQSVYSELFVNFFDSITVVNDGVEALEELKNNKFDIIISDIKMPNMNGIDLVKHIREKDKKICIIVYSAWDELESLKSSNELNICDYMSKPMQTDAMIKIFERVLCNKYGSNLEIRL